MLHKLNRDDFVSEFYAGMAFLCIKKQKTGLHNGLA
jgi:hypothetical protein